MKYIKLKFLLLVFFASFSQVLFADIYVQCPNCSDASLVAKNSAPYTNGSYIVHVADFETGVLKSFSVFVANLSGEPGLSSIRRAFPITSDAALQAEFQQFMITKNDFIQALKDLVIPSNILDTSWDLYADQQAQDAFLQYVYDNATIGQQFISLGNALTGWAKIVIDIQINLSTGAKIMLTYTRTVLNNGDVLALYKIDFAASRDENGNPLVIPTSGGGGSGGSTANFTNGTQSLVDFLAAASRAGIPITSGGDGGGYVSCSLSGNVLTCVYYASVPT